jgi:predicted amidohydrolase
MSRKIKVAAIQLKNYAGEPGKSLEAAEKLIKQAAEQGAVLAVLPELSTCGYIPNPAAWNYAEPPDGRTVKWASSLAKKYRIHIGAGYIGCDGKDFYNSYLIMNPKGHIDSIVRKKHAETYCFEEGNFGVYADTELGRIGIGICADSHYLSYFERIKAAGVDLVILPHAWPTPSLAKKQVTEKDIGEARETLLNLPKIYARYLNLPVIFANSVGDVPPMPGILGRLMSPELFRLQGMSQIVDTGAKYASTMDSNEGFIVAEVEITEDGPCSENPPDFKGWLHPGSKFIRKHVMPFDEKRGRKFYLNSPDRLKIAQQFDYEWADQGTQ